MAPSASDGWDKLFRGLMSLLHRLYPIQAEFHRLAGLPLPLEILLLFSFRKC